MKAKSMISLPKKYKKNSESKASKEQSTKKTAFIVIAMVAVVGTLGIVLAHAESTGFFLKPDKDATLDGNAVVQTDDPTAIGGTYLQFGSVTEVATPVPTPTLTPTPLTGGAGQGVFGGTWDGVAKSFVYGIFPNYNKGGEFLTMASRSATEHRNFYITHHDNDEVPAAEKIAAVHKAGGKIVFYTNPSEIGVGNGCGEDKGTSNPISGQEALSKGWISCGNIGGYGVPLTDVNNAAYRQAYLAGIMKELDRTDRNWDGINMDNLWSDPGKQYGNRELIKACVAMAHTRGKICGGNLTTFDPGGDAEFINWTNSIAGIIDFGAHEFFGSWGGGITTGRLLTQLQVTENLTSKGTGVLMYVNLWKSRPASEALTIFGASMLVANKNTRYQMDTVQGDATNGNYANQWRLPEMDKNYGQPLENRVTLATNTFRRKFQNGTVYVNLDGAGHTVDGVYIGANSAVFK